MTKTRYLIDPAFRRKKRGSAPASKRGQANRRVLEDIQVFFARGRFSEHTRVLEKKVAMYHYTKGYRVRTI